MMNKSPLWVKNAIFYQIFPERFANGDKSNDPENTVSWESKPTRENFFGGDLQGIIDNLSYLNELGVNAIYLNPIFRGNTNHKYDTSDYMSIDPSFGSTKTLRTLVSNAHNSGLRIILDAVFNHCGAGFPFFEDTVKHGKASKYYSWFHIDSWPIIHNPPSYQTAGGAWYLPKLNFDNPQVRDYLLKVATHWIEEFNIDGWRLDIPWKVPVDFWQEFHQRVRAINPEVYIVGELWRDFRPWINETLFDGTMNYVLREYLFDYCIHRTMDAEDFDYFLKRQRDDLNKSIFFNLNLLGSHDTPRILTIFEEDIDVLLIALTFIFTYVGAPMVYYGDEVGMTGENDPDCRKTMLWDRKQWNSIVNDYYKKLISLRTHSDVLRSGEFETLRTFNGVFAYRRTREDDEIIVVLNPRGMQNSFSFDTKRKTDVNTIWVDYIGGKKFLEQQSRIVISPLKAKSALILVGKDGNKKSKRESHN